MASVASTSQYVREWIYLCRKGTTHSLSRRLFVLSWIKQLAVTTLNYALLSVPHGNVRPFLTASWKIRLQMQVQQRKGTVGSAVPFLLPSEMEGCKQTTRDHFWMASWLMIRHFHHLLYPRTCKEAQMISKIEFSNSSFWPSISTSQLFPAMFTFFFRTLNVSPHLDAPSKPSKPLSIKDGSMSSLVYWKDMPPSATGLLAC